MSKKVQPQTEQVKPMDIGEIKTDFALECRKTMQTLRQKYKNVKTDVSDLGSAQKGQSTLEAVTAELDRISKDKKHSMTKLKTPVKQIQQAIAQLPEFSAEIRAELSRDLTLALDRDATIWQQSEISKLKSEIAEKSETLTREILKLKKVEADHALRAKIATLKNVEEISRNSPIVRQEISVLPLGVKETLWHPMWVSRKFEREFGVLVEKITSAHIKFDGLVVSGLSGDVANVAAKMDKLDFSGRRTLVLDSRSFVAVQAKIPDAEKMSGAYIVTPGASELCLLGSLQQVEKAMVALGNFREIANRQEAPVVEGVVTAGTRPDLVSEKVAIGNFFLAKGFVSDSLGFLSEIDKAEKVAISVSTNLPTDHYVVVRGEAEAVARTTAMIRKFLDSEIWSEEITDHPMALFESSNRARGVSEGRLYAKFAQLKRTAGIFIAQHEGVVGIVGRSKALVESIANETRKFMVNATYLTDKYPLNAEHRRCWGERSCTLVGERSCGAELARWESSLEIWGPEEARKKAVALMNEFHRPVVITMDPQFPIQTILENKAMALTEIQELTAVHIYLDKVDRKIFIYGLSDCKEDAQEQLDRLIATIQEMRSHLNIREIPDLTSHEVARLIGPKGSVIRKIKETSGCDDVQVDDGKCVLTGSKSAVDSAILFIEEILDSKKITVTLQGEEGEIVEAPRTRILELNKTSVGPDGPSVIPAVVPRPMLDCVDEFPSLGSLVGKKGKKK